MNNIKRFNLLEEVLKKKSVLLLGPRRTGKSFFIQHQVKPDLIINLLEADTFRQLSARPERMREQITDKIKLVAIDEIQKLPILMDEVHNLIETKKIKFILTGSSARKLKREHTSLMAGRAKRVYFHPFSWYELQGKFDLDFAINFGGLPPVVFAEDPWDELKDYAGLYLKEEIQSEAIVRKIENFSRFLEFAAIHSGELLNYESIGSDAQVPARTIREYYSVMVDTLMGDIIAPLALTKKRKSVSTSKFYFFDTGVLNSLLDRKNVSAKTIEYGLLFEHFIFKEIKAYIDYFKPDSDLSFWRINEETEVDFVVNKVIAIEVKATENVAPKHLKGLLKFAETGPCEKQIIVSKDKIERKMGDIRVLPYQIFLKELWAGKIF